MLRKTRASEDWEDIDGGSIAVSTTRADYKEGGKHIVESGFNFDTASAKEIKAKLGDMRPGEVKTLNQAHSWKLQRQISSAPGEKACKFRLVESDGLDVSPNAPVTNMFTDASGDAPVDPSQGPSPLQVLKNMVDKHHDLSLVVLAIAIFAAVCGAVALGGLIWSVI